MPEDEHDLRVVLRDEADRHTPDRAAMLERIERGRRPLPRLLRPVLAALAVAAVLAGVRLTEAPAPAPDPAIAAPTPRFSTPSPVRVSEGAVGKLDPHSFASWSQQQVTLTTRETITRLDVTISIARSEGVADTGRWTTIPAGQVTTSVRIERRALVYRFTLKPGGTLAPGSYVFAAQFNHIAGARPLDGDSFTVVTGEAPLTGGFSA